MSLHRPTMIYEPSSSPIAILPPAQGDNDAASAIKQSSASSTKARQMSYIYSKLHRNVTHGCSVKQPSPSSFSAKSPVSHSIAAHDQTHPLSNMESISTTHVSKPSLSSPKRIHRSTSGPCQFSFLDPQTPLIDLDYGNDPDLLASPLGFTPLRMSQMLDWPFRIR